MPIIQHVKFHSSVTAEWCPGGTEDWSSTKHGVESRVPVAVEDKGNSLHFTWTSPGPGKHAGKLCRLRVPLTNIAAVFEVDEGKEKK